MEDNKKKDPITRPEDSQGQRVLWPGDGLKKARETVKGKNGETTIIPLVR